MTRSILFIALMLPLFAAAREPVVIPLWPDGPEEPSGFTIEAETVIPPKSPNETITRVTNVSTPTLTIYQPEKPNGTSVLVCPGGGYSILAIDHEGTMVCDWLVSHGVTAALLKYRVPRRLNEIPSKYPLQDTQRAMSLLRRRAAEWSLDPARIGILGFSAGGHLCIMTALHANERTYSQDATIDIDDATPNFAIPIYPAYLLEDEPTLRLKPEIRVTETSPPICFIHANDDKHSAAGSALLYTEYRKLNIPAELHIFEKGGHGFGIKTGDLPVNAWPERVAQWMQARGLLPTAE